MSDPTASSPEVRLAEVGIVLPAVGSPAGSYVPAVSTGDLVFLSGNGPITDGTVIFSGAVGTDLTSDEGYQAARLTAINLLAALRAEIGSLDRVKRVVKLLGWVNSAPGFYQQHGVIDGASDLFAEVFGGQGVHARSAIAANQLVFNMAVEIEMVVQLKG
ncbi:MAG: RidA family protein [Bifidobacterium crudilactis]|nr:RidA family protein [Bifidobacterium crudilactis]